LTNFVGNLVFRVFGIFNAERKVRFEGAFWWGFGITVSMRWVCSMGMVRLWVLRVMNRVMRRAGREYQGYGNHHGYDL
jgi:hypothetical protein